MATPSEQLAAALVAYETIMNGKQVRVFVDQNGERVEYNMASADKLREWIQRLQAQINCPGAPIFAAAPPLRFFF